MPMHCVFLAFDNNRHHDGCSSCEEVTVLCDLSAKYLNETSSINLWIFEKSFLICRTNSLEYLLVHWHHLMSMDKPTWIDKNMSCDSSKSNIFFESKDENSIFCELFTIWECITCEHSDRFLVYKKSVKSELESTFCMVFPLKIQYLTSLNRHTRKSIYISLTREHKSVIRCPKKSYPCLTEPQYQGFIQRRENKISNSSFIWTLGKKLEKSTFFEKFRIGDRVTKLSDNLTRSIYRRKAEGWKYMNKDCHIYRWVAQYPCLDLVFFMSSKSHIRKRWIRLPSSLHDRKTSPNKNGSICTRKKHKRIRSRSIRKYHHAKYIYWLFSRKKRRLHPMYQSSERWFLWESNSLILARRSWRTRRVTMSWSSSKLSSRVWMMSSLPLLRNVFKCIRIFSLRWCFCSSKRNIMTITKNMVHNEKDKRNISEFGIYLEI